ncbi:hypothetical protein JXJ21_23345 [candidate division KSB1 bacterium]|nr:hypothetical protein [candidate division KSB1 bacterium]
MEVLLIVILAILCVVGYYDKKLSWFSLPVAIGTFVIGSFLIVRFRDTLTWLLYIFGIVAIIFVILIIISKLKK